MSGKLQGTGEAVQGALAKRDRLRLQLETGCDERTIRKWERGEDIKDASRQRLEGAAGRLGIAIPEGARREVPPAGGEP